jgi:type II secretory pathway component PulK
MKIESLRGEKVYERIRSERGVALIIVLLVTALLIALIFEFWYSTRVSLRAATNFRDSQRAYFLARSGLQYFVKYKGLKDMIPQGEWAVVPIISTADIELRIKWEDEGGKINIKGLLAGSSPFTWCGELFRLQNVDQEILNRIAIPMNQPQSLSELHKFMKDEEYNKVAPFLTFYSKDLNKVNINYASEEVLRAVQSTSSTLDISGIMTRRKKTKYADSELGSYPFFTASSTVFKVYTYATAGGYTKQIEAVMDVDSSGTFYWRAL